MKIKVLLFFITFSLSVSAQHSLNIGILSNGNFNAINVQYKKVHKEHFYYSVGILAYQNGAGFQFKLGAKGKTTLYPFIETSLSPITYEKKWYSIPIHALGIGYKYKKIFFQVSVNKNKYFGYGAEAGYTF